MTRPHVTRALEERHQCEYCRLPDSERYASEYRLGFRLIWLCGVCRLELAKRVPEWLAFDLSLAPPRNREYRRWQRQHEAQIRTETDRLLAGARKP